MSFLTTPLELSPHLYIVYAEFPHVDCANVYLIAGQKPTLIDCGSPRASQRLARNLEQIGLSVTDIAQVIVTHGDYDHIQGLHALLAVNPGLQVYLHHDDWPSDLGDDSWRNSSYLYGQPFLPFAAQQFRAVDHGDILQAGDTAVKVVHTPGHTEGSISLLGDVDGHAVLFVGDVIGGAMKSLGGVNLEIWAQAALTWQQSLQRLLLLEFDWVLNGHEPIGTLPITRAQVERLTKSFGLMLNPWFLLGEDEPPLPLGPPVALAGDLPLP